jgi:nicotinamide/nicotinate riboside kinase
MELVPTHPVHGVQDWDAAPGAISWQRLIDFLRAIKRTGKIPPDHRSHDHLNEQKIIVVDGDTKEKWMEEFKSIQEAIKERTGKKVIFGILDGFLLYWHPVSTNICLHLRRLTICYSKLLNN